MIGLLPGTEYMGALVGAARVIKVTRQQGVGAGAGAAFDEWKNQLKGLPVVNWFFEGEAASDAQVAGDAYGEEYHRTSLGINAAGDTALIIGGSELIRAGGAPVRGSGTLSVRVNLLNPANPEFGANDLVYGLYQTDWPGEFAGRFNPTEALRRRAGGRLLSDDKIPSGMAYQYSVRAMEDAVAKGNMIRFNVTYVDTKAALGAYGPHAGSITSMELRYIQQNWGRFETNVKFYRLNKVVAPPWQK